MQLLEKRIGDLIFYSRMNLAVNTILMLTISASILISSLDISNLKTQVLNSMPKEKVAIDTIVFEKHVDTVILKTKPKSSVKVRPFLPIDSNYVTAGVDVRATVYNAVVEQCDSDPSHTAFMFKLDLKNPFKHRIIAVSRDLEQHFPNNTLVRLEGTAYDGIYTVKDRMHPRCRRQIDILINKEMQIGNWHNAKIFKM